ncbi:MAG: CHAP domain-containing protein [Verrucomicrobiota bacterium]
MPAITAPLIAAEIIRQAALYENLLERRPNAEWDHPATPAAERALSAQLTECMESAGWQAPWPYCIAFAEGMLILALRRLGCQPWNYARPRQLITPHVMTTVRNLSGAHALSATPVPGSIWLARHGNSDLGHAGIVIHSAGNGLMTTIEGNTTSTYKGAAKDRQGDGIFRRGRALTTNGDLRTMGFLTPDAILRLLVL